MTREEAWHLTAREVYEVFCERVDVDHIVPRAVGGPDHHANYQPLARKTDHKAKTKVDRREIAKTDRLEEEQKQFRQRLLAKAGLAPCDAIIEAPKRSTLRSRPLPGTKKSGMRRRMSGKVERWTDGRE